MKTAIRKPRVFIGHSRKCVARRQKGWPHPWAFGLLDGVPDSRNSVLTWKHPRTGKKLRGTWVAFICNDTACSAVAGFPASYVDARLFGEQP